MPKTKRNNVAFIFARGGSKEITKKNIQLLDNLPLIAYSIKVAKQTRIFDDIIVSTDSKEIAEIAGVYGITTSELRPSELALDNTPEWLCWKYEVEKYLETNSFSTFFSIPCTSPLRKSSDITNMKKFYDNNQFDLVLGICKSSKSPLFNMVKKDTSNKIDRILLGDKEITRRQDAMTYYDITTVCYITSPEYILTSDSMFDGSLGGFEIPRERSLDIDTPYDLELAEFLIKKNAN